MRPIVFLFAAFLLPLSIASAAPEAVPYSPHLAAIPETENNVCCVQGDSLLLAGSFTNQGYTASLLMFPRQVLQTHQVAFDPTHPLSYSFNYPVPAPGDYHLRIGAVDLNEHTVVLRELHLTVLPEPPVLMERPTVTTDTLSIAALPQGGDFRPARVRITLGNESAEAQAANGLTAHLAVAALPAGSYTVSSQAWDQSGRFFDEGTVSVAVPDRLTLICASSFTLHKVTDKLPLSVHVADGVSLSNVAYFIDGVQIAASHTPPFTASGALSGFATGTHRLQARATLTTGPSFDSPPLDITLTNLVSNAGAGTPPKHPTRHKVRHG